LNALDRPPTEPYLAGWRIVRFASLGSTNDEARARALAGDPGRVWIVAEEQTAGRGRHGRAWRSPRGNLYASALMIDPCEAEIAPQIGFVAGVALVAAARDLGAADVAIKWPNDLLWNGAKVSGLLVEGLATPGRGFACMVGVGVNCVSSPQGLAYPVADLSEALGRPVAPESVLERLAARFDEMVGLWARGAGFADIRARWLAAAAGLGRPVRAASARETREGLFEGLDPSGRLLLRTARGLEMVEAADLFLTPRPDRGADIADESAN
jgi:BirA family biotin operon repressor/biotin-[acetyl-CoA-carboxylase] ligase